MDESVDIIVFLCFVVVFIYVVVKPTVFYRVKSWYFVIIGDVTVAVLSVIVVYKNFNISHLMF